MKSYDNLDSLLNESESAKIYFASLPDYVQGAVMKKSADIRTESDLRRIAEIARHEFM